MASEPRQPILSPPFRRSGFSISACDAIPRTLAREARQRQCVKQGAREGSAILSRDDAEPAGKPRHHGAGHRARLRARLLNGGAEALADYEVLEYLLYGAQARGDTKPLAKELLARFGSLSAVLDSRAMGYFRLGRYEDALRDWNAALSVSPELGPSLLMRGVVRRAMGDRGGQDDIRAALARAPSMERLYARFGIELD